MDIKTLADRFTEGETRIAAALRELKAHGYLAQVRKRLPNGRVVTHTVSYNRPQDRHLDRGPSPTAPKGPPRPASDAVPPPPPAAPEPRPTTPAPPSPSPAAKPPLPEPPNPRTPTRSSSAPPPPSSPRSTTTTHASSSPNAMCGDSPPPVAAWLERGARPEAVRHSLTSNLPQDPVRHSAALLAHRLTEFLPAPAPPAPPPGSDPVPVPPMVNCDGCDRGFRTWEKNGRCRDCREAGRGSRGAET
ncbi:helix-turn-helix domain-containing protein [Streptomyces canus]|uniref:helix-turn-helix domain-containing protein n=1 Tax=Streptomyces canus TaxID=58343 RepID=UPI0033C6D13E